MKQTEAKKRYLKRWRKANRARVRATERAWRAKNAWRLKLMRARAMKSIVLPGPELLVERERYTAAVLARLRERILH